MYNLNKIDVFFINHDFKYISTKRLENILRRNKKKLAQKAVLYIDDYLVKKITI